MGKNPLAELGYVDFLLTNLSTNNRLTESVNHMACAFPTSIPESYAYEYNERGYPAEVITTYKPGGAITSSKKEYFYIVAPAPE